MSVNLRHAAALAIVVAIVWLLQPLLFPLFRGNINDILFGVGIVLIVGAYRGWRWLVDPPKGWRRFYWVAVMRHRYGKTFTVYFLYFLGLVFVTFGGSQSYRNHGAQLLRLIHRGN